MPKLLCSHTDCHFSQEVELPDHINGGHIMWYCREHRGPTEFLPRPGFKDCQFCNDEVTDTDEFRHNGGKLYHVDCLIQLLLLDKIHDLKNPLTGEVEDDSIPNAFKKLRSALRERARIYNKFINQHHGRPTIYTPGIYKTRVIRSWGEALDLGDLAVRDAVKELERLT